MKKIEIKKLGVIVALSDKTIRQVLLTKSEQDTVLATITLMHDHTIKVIDKDLDFLTLSTPTKGERRENEK